MDPHQDGRRTSTRVPARPLDRELDRLFAVPPAAFTAARDALARELAASRDARADRVKALRRPTLLVWALNRLARDRPATVGELLDAADRLAEGERVALGGGGAMELRAAADAFHAALGAAAREAEAVLSAGGHPPSGSTRVRLEAALRFAATGPPGEREHFRGGRLEREPAPAAGDVESALVAGAPTRRGSRPSAGPRREAARPDRLREARRRASEAEIARARGALTSAEHRARSARAAADEAERRAAERRARAAEAERTVADARRRLHEAEARLRSAASQDVHRAD